MQLSTRCILHDQLSLLFLVLRIHEVRRHGHQLVRLRPIPHATFLLATPMLTVLWFRQVQRLRRPIPRRKHKEYIAVLACLWWWTWGLVLNDIVRAALLTNILLDEVMLGKGENIKGPRRDRDVGCDPVAHLAPFRVFARGRIGVGQYDDICWVCV